jgi:hypothetical protein
MDELNQNNGLPEESALPRAETPEAAASAAEQIRYPSGMVLPARAPAVRESYPRRRAEGRDLALAAALLGFCFLLWDSLIWAKGLGLGEALGLAALLPAALLYLRRRDGRMTGYAWICAALNLLGALSLALSGDEPLKALTMAAMTPLFLIVLLERLGLRSGTGLTDRLRDHLYACFGMTFGRLRVSFWALTHSGSENSARSKRNRAVLIGLVCALPALGLLIPLLISSDAAFAGLVGRMDNETAKKGLFALIPAVLAALLLFALLFTSDRGREPLPGAPRQGVEPAAVAAFLAAVSAAYVLYLAAQFAYFTDAFRGLLPKDFTVAEYARRGFFEMCAIVAINLLLIVLAVGLCRKEGGRVPAAVKGLALFLCVFSLILVATALSKMVLYMGSFGLTRLRVLTSVFMVFLALVVIVKAIQLFVRKIPVPQLVVTLGAAILIALSLANVDGLVARYNVDAWRSGRLDSLDMETICWLGDGATPVLADLAEDSDPAVSEQARKELKYRDSETDWRSWNLISQQANNALGDVISKK